MSGFINRRDAPAVKEPSSATRVHPEEDVKQDAQVDPGLRKDGVMQRLREAGWMDEYEEPCKGPTTRYRPSKGFTQWKTLGLIAGWDEASRRLNNEATTFGVLSALLVTLAFPTFIAPPDFSGKEDTALGIPPSTLEHMFGVTNFLAIVFAIADICTAAIAITQLGGCSTEADLAEFISRYEFLFFANFQLFMLSIVSLTLASWAVLVYRYPLAVVLVCWIGMALAAFGVGLVSAQVYNNFTLKNLKGHHRLLLEAAARPPPSEQAGEREAKGGESQGAGQRTPASIADPTRQAQQ